MISRILIIISGGILCYSKNFFATPEEEENSMDDLVGGFLTALSSFAIEIKGGEIRALAFRKFNYIYEYDDKYGCMFVIVTDIADSEEEARKKVLLLMDEFIRRYSEKLEVFSGCVSDFQDFDSFVEENIFIPPIILLVGELGVGKTTIMNLFPGETVLELDEDFNEIIEKPIEVSGLEYLKRLKLREIDLEEIVDKSKLYSRYFDSVDIICIVTNSAASNLGRTKKHFSRLKPLVKKADLYIIANFQDLKDAAFDPAKIEEAFDVKTYGYSAIQEDSQEKIYSIFTEIIEKSIVEKIKAKQSEEV